MQSYKTVHVYSAYELITDIMNELGEQEAKAFENWLADYSQGSITMYYIDSNPEENTFEDYLKQNCDKIEKNIIYIELGFD